METIITFENGTLIKRERTAVDSVCICDVLDWKDTTKRIRWIDHKIGHLNQAGGFCCPHHGNTCGQCSQYNK